MNLNCFLLICLWISICSCENPAPAPTDPWAGLDSMIQMVQAPHFPDTTFSVLAYQAFGKGDGDDRAVIQAAIDACHAAGGGRVHVPPGTYFVSGALVLKSRVNLHLDSGAVIRFGTESAGYLPLVFTRWEGTELMNYSPLIYAFEAENIALTGKGVLDGQASNQHWWPWNGKERFGWQADQPHQKPAQARLREMGNSGVPVAERIFGEGHFLRPSFFQAYRCKRVLVEGVVFRNMPMWGIHPVLCEHVIVRGVKVFSHGPNNDGVDPESSAYVLIEDCHFDTGDDCLAIKAGRDADGRRIGVPSRHIIMRNCSLQSRRSVLAIGSEMSGGVEQVFIENCHIRSLAESARLLRIKSSRQRGGYVRQVHLRKLDARKARFAEGGFFFDMHYGNQTGTFLPQYADFSLQDIQLGQAGGYAFKTHLLAESPLQGLLLRNIRVEQAERMPIFIDVAGLSLEEVWVNGERVIDEEN